MSPPWAWPLVDSRSLFYFYVISTIALTLLTFGIILYSKRLVTLRYLPFYLFLLGFIYFLYVGFEYNSMNYHPALKPKSGIKYHIVDMPAGLNKIHKILASYNEGKGEAYEIQGWLNNDTLIYKKWSGRGYNWISGQEYKIGSEQVLRYDIVNRKSDFFRGPLQNLTNKKCHFSCIEDFIEDYDVSSNLWEAWISPDGNKFAYWAKQLYGPQDIMIFEK